MGWKSKLSRIIKDKKKTPEETEARGITNVVNCESQHLYLKSCLKKKSVVDDGLSSFSSCSTGISERSSAAHERSQTTHSTELSASTVSSRSTFLSKNTTKNVRFHEIQIREYHRCVGDNPSVSAGPPVGIDWRYEESLKMDVNGYELNRGHRREQLEMVLSRHERETLLVEWDVPTHLIADGTRNAIKVKNQRKQTLVNAGKVAKLEEVIESASKRLKEAFSKKMKSMISVPHQSADEEGIEGDKYCSPIIRATGNKTISSEICEAPRTSVYPQGSSSKAIVLVEPDSDSLDRMGMNVSLSNLVSDAPEGTKMACYPPLNQYVEDMGNFENDDDYTLGATTFGNSSVSPSVLEMEKFYKELEMEMFGEEASLPCMVGQTLEVNAYGNDIIEYCDDITVASSAQPIFRSQMTESTFVRPTQDFDEWNTKQTLPTREEHPNSRCHTQEFSHRIPAFALQHSYLNTAWASNVVDQLHPVHNRERAYSHEAYDVHSEEESYPENPQLTSASRRRELQHLNSASSKVSLNEGALAYNCNTHPRLSFRHNVLRSNRQHHFDGPHICHDSLQSGHLSPHQWMGECDGPRMHVNAAVTIMEDC
ncbi:hypothetical protein IV203_029598 [Nitzschia inconspicua]|uniref:Uncharacterized protein n=1 Tax=Nitzschia inconspicua TaxID=303405 RepID=A0A9K3Q0W0_9STRA|nr:hypothetical protein IV203_029598 [Nitzschia inconspicua]